MELDDLRFEIQDEMAAGTRIKVVGVGGAGCNAVSRMMAKGIPGVGFYAMNTDAQALRACTVPNKHVIGMRVTQGLGAGLNPEVGRQAALEDTDKIIEILEGADMIFVAAGLGGGTGTGASPVVCSLAKELGALTVAVVTRPFRFEGPKRLALAEEGLANLTSTVDCVISIPNDRLVDLLPRGTTFDDAFQMADDVLRQGVQGISDIMTTPGVINRDFNDVRTIMSGMGFAMMGTAAARGSNAAIEAARKAMECPLLEDGGLRGARAILFNITASGRLAIHDIADACELIRTATGNPDVHMNFGLVANDQMGDEVRITIIATGFSRRPAATTGPAAVPVPPEPQSRLVEDGPASETLDGPDSRAAVIEPNPAQAPRPEPLPLKVVVTPKFEEDGFEFEDVETPAYLRNRRA
ncbi:MAG: cell division protein FtsZ [Bryobacterales bacterium]|nr:cell division protein FtsZ [Bryobacterales bacterium]